MENEHSLSCEEVLKEMNSSGSGLSEQEAAARLAQFGPNELKEAKKASLLKLFFSQFNNFFIYILIAAAVISMLLGEWLDSAVILAILVVNAVLGFLQEFRAEKSIEALRKLSGLKARVIRDGSIKEIPARELVPGDVISIDVGEKIPADARVLGGMNLEVQEAALTGESMPVAKSPEKLEKDASLADRKNMVFSGTIVTAGHAKAVVTRTGMSTQIGKIAGMIQAVELESTPIQKKLESLAKWLGWAIIFISAFVSFTGVLKGGKLLEMIIVGVSLAVAAIPEGLPAVVTISFALGVQRMAKRHALVRRLPLVETLGCATVICSDKTGTLTCNEMTVKKIYFNNRVIDVAGSGYNAEGGFFSEGKAVDTKDLEFLLGIGAMNNNAVLDSKSMVGDPTEIALLVSARKAGIDDAGLNSKRPRTGEIGFDSVRKMMTTIHSIEGGAVAYVKGAVEVVMEKCKYILEDGKVRDMNEDDYDDILEKNLEFAGQALRVLAFAYRKLDKGAGAGPEAEKDLVFAGLQAMIDPPRPEVINSIKECRQAGIKVVMITGDFLLTAQAVAREIGLDGKALTGKDIESGIDLDSIVEDVSIYARVNPEHKIRIVEALKKKGHIVAMTGDGVNDAPALKRSDIGVAMGMAGTDVAREASGMILTDDNFTSIVNAVEEGRVIYDNIKKFVGFLLSCNMGEVMVLFIAMLIGFRDELGAVVVPLTAIQILWMNLVTDGLPALALSLDPSEKGIMKRLPRRPNEKIVSKNMLMYIFAVGALICVGALFLFDLGMKIAGVGEARTMAFTGMVVLEMVGIGIIRSQYKTGIFSNIYLILAVASSIILQVMVIYIPVLNRIFRTVPLGLQEWMWIAGTGVILYIAGNIAAFVIRKLTSQRD